MKDDKKLRDVGYQIGGIIGIIVAACVTALIIGFTARILFFLF